MQLNNKQRGTSWFQTFDKLIYVHVHKLADECHSTGLLFTVGIYKFVKAELFTSNKPPYSQFTDLQDDFFELDDVSVGIQSPQSLHLPKVVHLLRAARAKKHKLREVAMCHRKLS